MFLFYYFSLLLYGVVCTLLEKHDVAETFFEAATCVQPKSILAWTMLGMIWLILINVAICASLNLVDTGKYKGAVVKVFLKYFYYFYKQICR